MTRTVTAARSWFRLDRHDVRSTLPPQIIAVMQDGILDRTFQDALLPNFLFPAVADNSPWSGGMGDTRTFTRTGLITPNPTPITGSDPTPHTYGVEQWSVTMDQYGDTIDTNLLQSAMTLASLYLRDVQTLGVNAGQTLNRVARNKLYAAYAGGRTWCRTAGTSDTSIEVASVDGFTHVLVNGVPTPVSGSNPLNVTISLADELLDTGAAEDAYEANDLLRQRDEALQMAITAVMESGDEPAWCIPCGKWTFTPPPQLFDDGTPDRNDWVCWGCRARRESDDEADR